MCLLVDSACVHAAVTFANCLTGHISWGKGCLYVLAQLFGAIFGALIAVSADPASEPR